MGTIIEAGTNYSSFTTEKLRFTKQAPQVTQGEIGSASVEVSDSFQSSGSPAPSGQAHYSDFDPGTRALYRDTVKDLATAGRLYVRDNDERGASRLRRADPMEIKERLDHGQPVEVVTRVASESSASGSSSSSSDYKQRGIFTQGYNFANESHSSSRSERVFYSTSSIREWDSLDFASPGQGVMGVAQLPASGGSVVVSDSFESEWSSRASRQWGFFTEKNVSSSSSGYNRVSHKAD